MVVRFFSNMTNDAAVGKCCDELMEKTIQVAVWEGFGLGQSGVGRGYMLCGTAVADRDGLNSGGRSWQTARLGRREGERIELYLSVAGSGTNITEM